MKIQLKNKLILVLTMIMLVMAVAPALSFATTDKGMEKAIKTAKEKLTIPSKLTQFDYNINYENNVKVWSLNWSSKNENDGSVNVRIDDEGIILSYSYYKPYDYNSKKLPNVSKKDALEKAKGFMNKLTPGILKELKYVENPSMSLSEPAYFFSFVRMVNGLPFNNNGVSVDIDKESGDVCGYTYTWTKNAVFPDQSKSIAMDKAIEAYKKNLGLRLTYNYSMDKDKIKLYAVYSSVYSSDHAIDALTGEKIQIAYGHIGPYYGGYGFDMALTVKGKNQISGPAADALTPEEIKAVEDVSKLISQEDAEKIARSMKVLDLSSYKLTTAELMKDWVSKDEFIWNLNFGKDAQDEKLGYDSTSVRLDAKTGEIRSFYSYVPGSEDGTPKFDKSTSKAEVEKLLKELVPDKFASMEYDDITYIQPLPLAKEPEKSFSFNYMRKVNGILFPGNSINVSFDAVNGRITSFDLSWFNLDFPKVDKVLSLDQVYDIMFKEIGLELQYKNKYSEIVYERIIPGATNKSEVVLVYAVRDRKPLQFDANTGTILDYDGTPFKEKKPAEYTDIKGHFAEKKIQALVEFGIALEGNKFNPNAKILQKDFMTLLSQVFVTYYHPMEGTKNNDEKLDELYNMLIREGIIKASEKAPNANVSREDAVKFVIRALKFEKVAEIPGIYKYPFKDISKANPKLIGHITIANGLGLISGNNKNFQPKSSMTRAETMVVIYNYLKQ